MFERIQVDSTKTQTRVNQDTRSMVRRGMRRNDDDGNDDDHRR